MAKHLNDYSAVSNCSMGLKRHYLTQIYSLNMESYILISTETKENMFLEKPFYINQTPNVIIHPLILWIF